MPLETVPFYAFEYLDDAESIAAYLADAMESGSAEEIADAIAVVSTLDRGRLGQVPI